jgi:hypothetical protein
MKRALIVALLVGFSPLVTFAQSPASLWRTITLPHFRVHYAVEDEAWATRVARRLESIRGVLIEEIGYAPPQKVDILISDPLGVPDGMAVPLLRSPRMVLFPTAPTPAFGLGKPVDWSEMVALHESAHLVHLLRPSRSPFVHLVEKLIPAGPITSLAPRWIHEGYATLLEGKLTGAGRPNSDLRAAILRRWAQAGRLPSYEQLASDARSWLGMNMAYLAGSAYLEWLVERTGPDSLKKLWARLTARAGPNFDNAFSGVFGDRPRALYSRFCAELTFKAIEAQQLRAPIGREGELWQDLTWSTGEPALSPDGGRLVVVVRGRGEPSRIVIWSIGPNSDGEKQWQQQVDRTLQRDPEDVTPVRSRPLPRKALFDLVARNGTEPLTTRFAPDGKAILFVSFEPDGNGFLHPDLFRWRFEDGRVERITHLADVRDVDPSPDGRWAVGVRARHGFSQLVRIDLETGAVQAITEPSLDIVYSSPRFSPTGDRIVYSRGTEKGWALVVRILVDGSEKEVDVGGVSLVALPGWFRDGKNIVAVAGQGGFVDIARFAVDGHSRPEWLTRTDGAASAPVVTPDARGLFFLSLEPDGLALRHIGLEEPATSVPVPDLTVALAPAVPPRPPEHVPAFASESVPPPHTYGLGRQEISPLTGVRVSPSGRSWELGLRMGDVVGKLDVLAVGALSRKGEVSGGTLAAVWRGWPVAVGLQAFGARERPSEQADLPLNPDRSLDVNRMGAEVRAEWARVWRPGRFELTGGGLWNGVQPEGGASISQTLGFVGAQLDRSPSRGKWSFTQKLSLQAVAGRTGDSNWRRFGGSLTVGVGLKGTGVSGTWERRSVQGTPSTLDRIQLGGMPATILPESAQSMQVFVPALPIGTASGDEYEKQRAECAVAGLSLFLERHRLWDSGRAQGEWLRVAGFSIDVVGRPQPLVRLPAVTVRLGVARILDAPFKDKTRWWLGVVYRP